MSQPDPLLLQLELLYAARREKGAPDAVAVGEQLLAAHGEPADDLMRVHRAELRTQIGEDYAKLGDIARAMSRYREALDLLESAVGTQSVHLAPLLVKIARAELAIGEAQAAETTLNRAATLMSDDGSEGLPYAEALVLNGQLLHRTGRLDDAKNFLREVLAMFERKVGPDSLPVSDALNSLAMVLRQCGELDEAIALQERSLAILDRFRLKDATLTVTRLCDFAQTLADKGDRERARHVVACARPLVDVPEAPLSQTLARVLEMESDLAVADGSDPRHAVGLRKRILNAQIAMLGPEHVDVGLAHHNLGISLHHAGDIDEALPHFVRAREISEQAWGTEHPTTLAIRGSYLRLLVALGQLDEAETGLTALISALKAMHGASSIPVADAEATLAEVRQRRGDVPGAIALLSGCASIREKILGALHPRHVDTIISVGLLLGKSDDHLGAADCFSLAFALSAGAYGEDHIRVVQVLELLFHHVIAIGQVERAQRIAEELVRIHERRGSSQDQRADALERLRLIREVMANRAKG